MRFPLKAAHVDMGGVTAKIRPEHKIVQLSYPVDTEDHHYNSGASPEAKCANIVHESSVVPTPTSYAVGRFQDGEYLMYSLCTRGGEGMWGPARARACIPRREFACQLSLASVCACE